MPSHPFGWSAGKWREWYPDGIEPDTVARDATRCGAGAVVRQWSLVGAGHGWPGVGGRGPARLRGGTDSKVDATGAILAFFRAAAG